MESQHFKNAQLLERIRIKELFDNYLRRQNCHNLIYTSTEDCNTFDFICLSAITKTVCGEFKLRDISFFKYADCYIEHFKYNKLYDWFLAKNHTFYIVEYQQYYAIWNLNRYFQREQIEQSLKTDHYFTWQYCTGNSDPDTYSKGERLKLVRGMKFHDCEYLLTKDFQRLTYAEMVEHHKNQSEQK